MSSAKQTWMVIGVGAVALLCCAGIITSGAVFLLRDASGEVPEAAPTTATSVNAEVDPCLVGRWHMVAATQTVAQGNTRVEMKLIKGSSLVVLNGDGTGTYDLSDPPTFTGSSSGIDFKVIQAGSATSTFTAQDGVLHEKIDLKDATFYLYIDREPTEPIKPEPQDNTSSYTCDETSLVVWNENQRNEYVRE